MKMVIAEMSIKFHLFCFVFQGTLRRAMIGKFIKEVLVSKKTILDNGLWKKMLAFSK